MLLTLVGIYRIVREATHSWKVVAERMGLPSLGARPPSRLLRDGEGRAGGRRRLSEEGLPLMAAGAAIYRSAARGREAEGFC